MAERWQPLTEHDLWTAAKDGLLDENIVGVELKQRLPSNKDTAKELASLALYGGALLLGVVDPKHRDRLGRTLDPIEIDGVVEKIENIAGTIAPPVVVRPRLIPTEADPSQGFVWIDVPQSPLAPHMVDGRYWGRTGQSKVSLTDDQVRMHLTSSEQHEGRSSAELASFIQRFPSGLFTPEAASRPSAGLHLVLMPITARPEMTVDFFRNDPTAVMHELSEELGPRPYFRQTGRANRISDGYAFSQTELAGGQPFYASPSFELLEVTETGTLRFHSHRVAAGLNGGSVFPVFVGMILGSIRAVLGIGGLLAKHTDYSGSWALALEVGDIYGAKADLKRNDPFSLPTYSDQVYRSNSAALSSELRESVGDVVYRLTGRLLRGLGVESAAALQTFLDD